MMISAPFRAAMLQKSSRAGVLALASTVVLPPSLALFTVRCKSSQITDKPTHKALLVDVGGTLLETSKPVAEIYADLGVKYGDGRPFWRHAVATATGCADETYFEELYQFFARGEAWRVSSGAETALTTLRRAGVKVAVVSNFDSRLRLVLEDLAILKLFDAIIVSSEIGYEKPSREIFEAALHELEVSPDQAVHVGDDAVADKAGAEALGIKAWLWKKDVKSFQEIAERILGSAT